MERESFESEVVAKLLSASFVSIKASQDPVQGSAGQGAGRPGVSGTVCTLGTGAACCTAACLALPPLLRPLLLPSAI